MFASVFQITPANLPVLLPADDLPPAIPVAVMPIGVMKVVFFLA
jgi:hypothetical protein